MKRLPLVFVFLVGIGIGIYYYTNLENNYNLVQEYYDFPIPNDAKLVNENPKVNDYRWEPSTGTEVPISYRLMIKKSGWKQIKIEGANILYKKGGKYITLSFATDYIALSKSKF